MGAIIIASYGESVPPATAEQEARIDWVVNCLVDFNKIMGMKRAEVEKLFPKDGGIQFTPFVRYLHPECAYFKIDVYYDFKTDPKDQYRPISGPDDLVTNVSRPYIESPDWE